MITVNELSVPEIKLAIIEYINDFSGRSELAMTMLLNALKSQMSATDYQIFCNALAAAETITL